MALQIHETTAKSIVASTKVPSADFVINPYTGCQFSCRYCFARFMGRFVGERNENWGNYVYVKTNAVELMGRAAGTTSIKIEYLNLPGYVKRRFNEFLTDQPEDIRSVYAESQKSEYRSQLEPIIRKAIDRHGITLRYQEIIHHVGDQELVDDAP